MNLLSLLATLLLDATEYNKGLDEAQAKADSFTGVPEQKVKVDNSEFKDGLKDAEGEATVFEQVLSGVWEGIKDGLKVAGVGAAISKLVSELSKAVNLAVQLGVDVNKGSKDLNLSTKSYQEWNHALEQSGASINNLKGGISNINNLLQGVGKVSDKTREAFKALGVVIAEEITDEEGNVSEILKLNPEVAKTTEGFLTATLNALADLDSAEERSSLAEAIFGKNNNLATLLAEGSDGIARLKKEANDMGLVMSDEDIQNAVDFNKTITDMNNAIETMKVSLATNILPYLTDAVKLVTQIVAFLGGNGNKSLSEQLAESDEEYAEQIKDIEGTAAAAETLADKLLAMGDTSKMTAEQYEIWKGTANALIELVPSLGNVIDTETGQISANSDEIKENIKQWELLAKQKALQTLKEEKLSAITAKNKDLIEQSVEANRAAAQAEKERVEAIDDINAVLKKYGVDTVGEDATKADVDHARVQMLNKLAETPEALVKANEEMSSAMKGWTSANDKVDEANRKVEELKTEVEDGKKEYEEWLTAADQLYGGLDEDAASAEAQANALKSAIDSIPNEKHISIIMDNGSIIDDAYPNAIGNSYVPYDNYPALLHRGEKVLTATEARQSNNIDLSGLEERIAAAIRSGMDGVSVNSYINGKKVTEEVNKQTVNQLKARRYVG